MLFVLMTGLRVREGDGVEVGRDVGALGARAISRFHRQEPARRDLQALIIEGVGLGLVGGDGGGDLSWNAGQDRGGGVGVLSLCGFNLLRDGARLGLGLLQFGLLSVQAGLKLGHVRGLGGHLRPHLAELGARCRFMGWVMRDLLVRRGLGVGGLRRRRGAKRNK